MMVNLDINLTIDLTLDLTESMVTIDLKEALVSLAGTDAVKLDRRLDTTVEKLISPPAEFKIINPRVTWVTTQALTTVENNILTVKRLKGDMDLITHVNIFLELETTSSEVITTLQCLKANPIFVKGKGTCEQDVVKHPDIGPHVLSELVNRELFSKSDGETGGLSTGFINESYGVVRHVKTEPVEFTQLANALKEIEKHVLYISGNPHATMIISKPLMVTVYLNDDDSFRAFEARRPRFLEEKEYAEYLDLQKEERSKVDWLIYSEATRTENTLMVNVKRYLFWLRNKPSLARKRFYSPIVESAELLGKSFNGSRLLARVGDSTRYVVGVGRMGDIWLNRNKDSNTYESNDGRVLWTSVDEWIFEGDENE